MRKKSRITITLSGDTLKKIDRLIDEKTIRNRSHAIENILNKSLNPVVDTCIVLTGRKVNGKIPALKRIFNRHVLGITIDHLKRSGIKNFVICAAQNRNKIKQRFGYGENSGVDIKYIEENKLSGTAGAIKKAQKYVNNNSFLVIHGDILTDIDLNEFMKFHHDEGSIATMAVKPRISEKRYGKVILQGNKILEFIGQSNDEGVSIINTGVYMFEPEIFEIIPEDFPVTLENDIFPRLAEIGELSAYLFEGMWYDISGKGDLKQARQKMLVK